MTHLEGKCYDEMDETQEAIKSYLLCATSGKSFYETQLNVDSDGKQIVEEALYTLALLYLRIGYKSDICKHNF